MTRTDVEMAMIQMGKALRTIVNAYKPNANHMSITVVNGNISVSACEYDVEKEEYVERDILDATMFSDGVIHIDGKYIKPDDAA